MAVDSSCGGRPCCSHPGLRHAVRACSGLSSGLQGLGCHAANAESHAAEQGWWTAGAHRHWFLLPPVCCCPAGPSTTEIHLSHNQLGVAGAKALLAAVPLQRSKGLKPLWLRLEWNQIDATELRRFIEQVGTCNRS